MILEISVSLVAAVILGELVSMIWYSESTPWGRAGDRYIVTAILCDVALAIVLQNIVGKYWRVGGWEDAAILALWLTAFYAVLEAPHSVWNNQRACKRFSVHCLHKATIIFVMLLALHHFRNY